MYEYRATVVNNYDGDTCRADVDLGFRVTLHQIDFRLLGINAPELHAVDPAPGQAAKVHLAELLAITAGKVVIRTALDRQEKYGRWLGTLLRPNADGTPGLDLNMQMVADGYAVLYP